MMARTAALACALLFGVAACSDTPTEPTPKPTPAPVAAMPTTGGFSPLRAQVVDIPGHGTFSCTPVATGGFSGCTPAPAGTTVAPSAPEPTIVRPGALPISAVGGPPDLPPSGTPITIPTFDDSAEIPMTQG